jgi:peptide/nickel transport system ATP-binding protein
MDQTILQVKSLKKYFPCPRSFTDSFQRRPYKVVHAVDDVSFEVRRGEILALVGESGSGKTTVGMNVLGLQLPTEGRILFDGHDVTDWASGKLEKGTDKGVAEKKRRDQVLALRRRAQIIFQDPYESLNPRQKVYETIMEPLDIHDIGRTKEEKETLVREALEGSGLAPAEHFWDRYPERLSGGQRQRLVIATALVLDPELLVADEPVSMLDVSIRAEILSLLNELRISRGISIIYTTHDLATAGIFTDRMARMLYLLPLAIPTRRRWFRWYRHLIPVGVENRSYWKGKSLTQSTCQPVAGFIPAARRCKRVVLR